MLGAILTLVFSFGMAGIGRWAFGRWLEALDPVARLPLAGMLALASVGTLTLFIGLFPGGLGWGIYPIVLLSSLGLVQLWRFRAEIRPIAPGGYEWAFIGALGLTAFFALISVLAPSDIGEWDTLSHHLASVKLWIAAGQITPIPFMHQSNFPFAVDNLYIWGHMWGGQAGAKMFSLVFLMFGTRTIFGLAFQIYGRKAAWWSALLFITIPVVLWESGTAYIDVAHGLFAGLGILFACQFLANLGDRRWMWLCGVCLGFAAGTKYTGLQTMLVVGATLLLFGLFGGRRRESSTDKHELKHFARYVLPAAALTFLIACPWYIKNYIWNGNPVYPFFYEQLGGENWDERRAAIYTNEQRTFGVGRGQMSGSPSENLDPSQLGHSILGLAYQPGRYVNPGQTQGFGEPLGAVGVPLVAVFLLGLIRGRPKSVNASSLNSAILFAVGLSLILWFVLSQQSRYITSLAPPLAVLAAGLVSWRGVGTALKLAIAAQAAFTLYLMKDRRFDAQIQVVTGKVSKEDFQAQMIPFYTAAQKINLVAQSGKVALYDEVFGYLLDVPYIWANPGHSLLIPYDSLDTGESYADELKKQGFTHVYVSSMARMSELLSQPLTSEQLAEITSNWEIKWKVLIADAYATGRLIEIGQFRSGTLFELK